MFKNDFSGMEDEFRLVNILLFRNRICPKYV